MKKLKRRPLETIWVLTGYFDRPRMPNNVGATVFIPNKEGATKLVLDLSRRYPDLKYVIQLGKKEHETYCNGLLIETVDASVSPKVSVKPKMGGKIKSKLGVKAAEEVSLS